MMLQRHIIDKIQKKAQVFYEYRGEVVSYSIYMNSEDSSLGQKESDEIVDEFIVENNKKEIKVIETYVEGYKSHRFSAEFEDYGIYYQLRGIMEKEEFEKILKNLKFF